MSTTVANNRQVTPIAPTFLQRSENAALSQTATEPCLWEHVIDFTHRPAVLASVDFTFGASWAYRGVERLRQPKRSRQQTALGTTDLVTGSILMLQPFFQNPTIRFLGGVSCLIGGARSLWNAAKQIEASHLLDREKTLRWRKVSLATVHLVCGIFSLYDGFTRIQGALAFSPPRATKQKRSRIELKVPQGYPLEQIHFAEKHGARDLMWKGERDEVAVIVEATEDASGALFGADSGTQSVYKLYSKVRGASVGNLQELCNEVAKARAVFGKRVSYLQVTGHGSPTSLTLGPDSLLRGLSSSSITLNSSSLGRCLRPYLKSNAIIVLNACSTGVRAPRGEPNLVDALASWLPGSTVYGAKSKIYRNMLRLSERGKRVIAQFVTSNDRFLSDGTLQLPNKDVTYSARR